MSYVSPLYKENEVLRKVAQGDERAFRLLFNQYHYRLGAHIFRITREQDLAEEVVQDVFLKIWLQREALSDVQNFEAYLFTMSKNHALNCLKKVARERSTTIILSEFDDVLDEETADDDVHYLLIDEAIDQLPPQQRQVYLLSRHERLPYADIAAKLNLSRETVKKYLQISSESIRSYIHKKLIINTLIILLYFI